MGTSDEHVRQAVRSRYARIALSDEPCCQPSASYDPDELASVPPGADMGLGSGNPVRGADLQQGEVVLDLGSGGGLDALLAARQVGPGGRVIGVDMTPEMVKRAAHDAAAAGVDNVEFKEGLIEDLPLPDRSVDVVISNCVINLSPEKGAVFSEAFRVLRPGGRLVVSDVVAPERPAVDLDPESWAACVGGAVPAAAYRRDLEAAGFEEVEVVVDPAPDGAAVASATVTARKAG